MSKPSALRVLSSSRSRELENIIGVGVLSREAKLISCARGGANPVGESDKVDETERRFVRAGVRIGYVGGILEPVEFRREEGEDEPAGLSLSASSSGTVSGCLLPLESLEYRDSWSE